MIITCMLNFFNIVAYSIFTSKKTDTFNTMKLKIDLRYPLRNTPVVKGKRFREQNKKNLSVLGTMYFEMQL